MNIFVGNLARDVTEEDLKAQFAPFGEVSSVALIKDKYSGQPKGFAFVEMANKEEGEAALAGLKGKKLRVWEKFHVQTFETLGIAAQVVGQNDLYLAMQTGVIDCAVYPMDLPTQSRCRKSRPMQPICSPTCCIR